MKEIKACIFDLDGVIVDTAKYHYIAWNRLAKELGFNFTEHDNERLKGVSRMRSLEILLEIGGLEFSEEDMINMAHQKNEWYTEYIVKMGADEILPGVENFIAELKQNNIKIALGSASKNAMLILERIGILSIFDAIVDGNKVKSAKPDPEIFLKGAEELGFLPENCIVFEDAEAGIEAAINAGMRCVGIGSPENLSRATVVLPDMKNLDFKTFIKFLN
jgi:beta-phosphoglucomutase